MLRQLLAGRTEIRLGRLDPRRDLTFVADTVDAFIRAATAPGIDGDVIQLGTGRSESIADLFALACRLLDVDARAVEDPDRLRPEASEVRCCDPTRATPASASAGKPRRASRMGCAPRSTGCARSRHPSISIVSRSDAVADRIPLSVPSIGGNAARLPAGLPRDQLRLLGRPVRRALRARIRGRGRARLAVACASGTAALHLAFLVLDVGPGDDVLVADPDVRRLGQSDRLRRAPGPSSSTRNPTPSGWIPRSSSRSWTDGTPLGGPSRPPSRSCTCSAIRHRSTPILDAAAAVRHPGARGRLGGARRRLRDRAVRGPPGRHARAARRVQLQRQQADHDRRWRDARHGRPVARQPRPPPVDPGAPSGPRLRPRRGRLQLPPEQSRGGPRRRPARGARSTHRCAARHRRPL